MTNNSADNTQQNSGSETPHYAAPGLARRFAAMVYDSLLLMAVSVLYGALTVALNLAIKGIPATGERIQWGDWGFLVFAGWLITLAAFFCYFWRKSGQTLGMKTWRMKVFDENSLMPPSIKQCIIRCLLAPLSLLLLGTGYWLVYANRERQTLHDKLSHTRTLLLSKTDKS